MCKVDLCTNNFIGELVAHTGFEPVISALRGRCPRPLDECATLQTSGWGEWIRTTVGRFRVCCPTTRRLPTGAVAPILSPNTKKDGGLSAEDIPPSLQVHANSREMN